MNVPAATAALAVSIGALSLASIGTDFFFRRVALVPGNSFIGEQFAWNFFSANLVETNLTKLALQLGFVLLAGSRAELPVSNLLTRKLLLTVTIAAVTAGLAVTFVSMMMYMSTAEEPYLYKPRFGTGAVAAATAVSAHQLLGDALLFPGALPYLSCSHLPLAAIVISAVAQEGVHTSRDLPMTLLATLVAWVYLRWVHDYGNGCIGDTRDEFDFLSMLPPFARTPLVPLVKLLSALLLPLGVCKRATGDGMKTLPAPVPSASSALLPGPGGSRGGAGAAGQLSPLSGGLGLAVAGESGAADPVAERRRERALRALDRKLAELRTTMRGGPAPQAAAGAGPVGGAGAVATPAVNGGAVERLAHGGPGALGAETMLQSPPVAI